MASKLTLLVPLLCVLLAAPALAATHTVIVTDDVFELPGDDTQPLVLTIAIGDTVEFLWDNNSTNYHNVAQTDDNDSRNYNDGFRSGEPVQAPENWTLPASYTAGDDTLFFVCEPHAVLGMRGTIIVGAGASEDDDDKSEDTPGFGLIEVMLASMLVLVLIGPRQRRNRA